MNNGVIEEKHREPKKNYRNLISIYHSFSSTITPPKNYTNKTKHTKQNKICGSKKIYYLKIIPFKYFNST
jgi:hypothetical protein